MEVVLAFPGLEGLKAFRDWVETPDATLVGLAAQRFGGNPGTQELEEGETGVWALRVSEYECVGQGRMHAF